MATTSWLVKRLSPITEAKKVGVLFSLKLEHCDLLGGAPWVSLRLADVIGPRDTTNRLEKPTNICPIIMHSQYKGGGPTRCG